MKQATRRFLNLRKNARHVENVDYKPHPDAKPNQCYQNASAEAKRTNSKIVAGWTVGDYNKEHDQTAIIFHFWNCDADGNHYDTTPEPDGADLCPMNWDYVSDETVYFDCLQWCKDNDEKKYLLLPPSLKMRSKGIEVATREQGTGFGWAPRQELPFTVYDLMELRARFQKAREFESEAA